MLNIKHTINDKHLKRFEQRIAADKILTCTIVQNNETIFDYCVHRERLQQLHKINSVTKSVLSILVGIAIDQGKIPHVHVPVAHYFPKLHFVNKELMIRHLLTMTQGVDWREMGDWGGLPFPMLKSENWVEFTLAQETIEPIGTRMVYNSGCSQVLSAIVQKATDRTLCEFAHEVLFTPLGINQYHWPADPNGISIGGFGLELMIPDMLTIGQLMLAGGIWNGYRVVSDEWVKESTQAYYHTYNHIGSYGYHWWVLTNRAHKPLQPYAYSAIGYGGQLIVIVPELQMVITFTSNLKKQSAKPLQYVKELLLEMKT